MIRGRSAPLRVATVASFVLATVAAACHADDAAGVADPAKSAEDAGVVSPPVEGASPRDAAAPCTLSEDVVEHACLHATSGPFGDLASGQLGTEAHVVYRTPLGEGGAFEVSFLPARAGVWAFFVSPEGATVDVSRDGRPLDALRILAPTCRALGAAHVLRLAGEVPVAIRGRSVGAELRMLAERIDGAADLVGGCKALPALPDGGTPGDAAARDAGLSLLDGGACRSAGPCTRDDECCDYCHDMDHCH